MEPLLDARKYRWELFEREPDGPFTFLTGPSLEADHEVFFDEETFENRPYLSGGVWKNSWDYAKNGHGGFSFYGEGRIYEYAAMKLKDGRILFCITDGSAFTDTFHSAERITARYYILTEI